MSQRVTFDPKPAAEGSNVVFDFSKDLPTGETLTANTAATLYSGTTGAAVPACGAASISGGKATVKISGGVAGNTYLLTCTGTTSGGQILILTGYLVVTA